MKKILLSCSFVLTMIGVQAQFLADYLKAADRFYKKGDYYSASQYYEKYLNSQGNKKVRTSTFDPYSIQASGKRSAGGAVSTRDQAIYNLAECYRLLNFHVKAEPVYKQAMEFSRAAFPLVQYRYAATLRAQQKFEEAETAFTAFLAEYQADDMYKKEAARELKNLAFIKEQLRKKDLNLYSVNKAGAELNTTGASYAPAWLNPQTLLFTSTRPDDAAAKNKVYTNRVYQAAMSGGQPGAVSRLNLPQGNTHQGVVSLTPDGNTLYLTRWMIVAGKKTSQIYSSKKTGETWSEPVLMDAAVNVAGFNAQQPFVSADGKHFYFASDKPGGKGGYDIYYAELNAAGAVANIQSAGDNINSEYDEVSPYYHEASHSLIFSTNGRTGMGGYDFFRSKGAPGAWAEPVNLGYPVNSVKDDVYFVSRGGAKNFLEDVYLSSDRSAECCLEMFSLNKIRPPRIVSGTVVACDGNTPLPGATVELVDTVSNKTLSTGATDANGNYSIAIEDFQPIKVVAASTGYTPNSLHILPPADEEAERLQNVPICLVLPKLDDPLVVENIYFDFDKAKLREESSPALDRLVELLNKYPEMVVELSAHTDSKGTDRYNDRLSLARAKSVVKYLTDKGIDKKRLKAKGMGEKEPIALNENEDGSDNPDGRQQNRRTEFKIIKNPPME